MSAPRTQVLPPANGKKLWRVKRSVSSGNPASSDANSSLQCLNSSLRITAACKQFMSKRPPLKRPKSKPGMLKDFVFVDLSPVKTSSDDNLDDSESDRVSSSTSSPTLSFEKHSPLSATNESFSSVDSDSYADFSLGGHHHMQPAYDSSLLGLGLMNMPAEYPQPSVAELALQMQQEQLAFQRFLQFQSQFAPAPETPLVSDHKRTKSTSQIPRRKSAGGFQFKTYKGPNSVRKPQARKHRRCVSEPSVKSTVLAAKPDADANNHDLADFLHAPSDNTTSDVTSDLSQTLSLEDFEQFDLAYTPLTDLSDFENVDTLHKPIDLDMHCDASHLFKDEFDMSTFVSI